MIDSLSTGILLPDIPRALTALAEWLTCFIFLISIRDRVSNRRFVPLSIFFLSTLTVFLILTDAMNGALWFICMFIAVFLMYMYLHSCSSMSWVTTGYFCAEAFILAEFTASLHWQLYCYFVYALDCTPAITLALSTPLIYGGVCLIIYMLNRRVITGNEILDFSSRECLMAALTALAIFLISNIGFLHRTTPFGDANSSNIFNVRTLIDLAGCAVLYAYQNQVMNLHMQRDMMVLNAMLQSQYQQYEASRETQEMINYKYHDLKNYVLTMRQQQADPNSGHELLDQIAMEIQDYEDQNKTGNSVLDTLLTAKNIMCRKYNIEMTSVVNGSLLNFMDTIDICSIFGNALDNAIECERKITDPAKRMISLAVFSQGAFLMIRCENYCDTPVDLSEKIPRTTKQDTSLHGYGLKSMRHTVRKYGGEMILDVVDSWFQLKILIPLNSESHP